MTFLEGGASTVGGFDLLHLFHRAEGKGHIALRSLVPQRGSGSNGADSGELSATKRGVGGKRYTEN